MLLNVFAVSEVTRPKAGASPASPPASRWRQRVSRRGQLVALKLDASGTPHLALFEITSCNPLDGLVVSLTLG